MSTDKAGTKRVQDLQNAALFAQHSERHRLRLGLGIALMGFGLVALSFARCEVTNNNRTAEVTEQVLRAAERSAAIADEPLLVALPLVYAVAPTLTAFALITLGVQLLAPGAQQSTGESDSPFQALLQAVAAFFTRLAEGSQSRGAGGETVGDDKFADGQASGNEFEQASATGADSSKGRTDKT